VSRDPVIAFVLNLAANEPCLIANVTAALHAAISPGSRRARRIASATEPCRTKQNERAHDHPSWVHSI
jgi:hypothetical protein